MNIYLFLEKVKKGHKEEKCGRKWRAGSIHSSPPEHAVSTPARRVPDVVRV